MMAEEVIDLLNDRQRRELEKQWWEKYGEDMQADFDPHNSPDWAKTAKKWAEQQDKWMAEKVGRMADRQEVLLPANWTAE